ncbi:MAG: GTP-binding protein, partial [Ktedonobacteraceae bacterium]|nr:GTP-binding protein [Ktedonobacteraceae bacterium]
MVDHNNNPTEEEKRKEQLKKDIFSSIGRSNAHPRTARDMGISLLTNLPANINMVQNFMGLINWKQVQSEVLEGLKNNVVIIGQSNAGKSTLFNTIKGEMLSPTSPQAGTTTTLVRTDFGPFTLVDTPGHLPDVMKQGIEQASVIVLLIDSTRGLQESDRELYTTIKPLGKPVIIAVNKVDALKGGEAGDQFATEVAVMLESYGVIPISAKDGTNIVGELIPAIIEASPEAALAIGRELPRYRREAAQRIIRNSTLLALAIGLEPIPFIDIPLLLGTQVRLVLRLAALYGEPLSTEDAMLHARKLIATMAGGISLRLLAEQAAKLVPFGGDFVAGAIAGAATWSIGRVAMEYYENDKHLGTKRLQRL